MKVLVYGSGVIGSYLAHVLMSAGNDVTVLARGRWREQLETHGLRIRHHLQRSQTLDHPKVIGDISEGGSYDVVFAVMPYNKIGAILEPLAAAFMEIAARTPDAPMPHWHELRAQMPDWDEVRRRYGRVTSLR